MRIVCPNCEAQYEVPEEAIPASGREVQCSNCNKAWFQRPADDPIEALQKIRSLTNAQDAEATAEAEQAQAEETQAATAEEPAQPEPSPEPAPAPQPESQPAPEPAPSVEISDNARPDAAPANDIPDEPEVAEEPASPPPIPRKELDPEVADILREEAEREAELRAQDTAATEADSAETPRPQRVNVSSRKDLPRRGVQSRPAPGPLIESSTPMDRRKDILPNIDDVTRKLGKQGELGDDTAASETADVAPKRENKAFTRGFAVSLLFAVVMWFAYTQPDQIAAQVPAAAPYLQTYVESIDQARNWIDQQVGQFVN